MTSSWRATDGPGRILDPGHPLRRATYELRELGPMTLTSVLEPLLRKWRG